MVMCEHVRVFSHNRIRLHHALFSERLSFASLSRSLCRWMARQIRQRTPPLKGSIDIVTPHHSYMCFLIIS